MKFYEIANDVLAALVPKPPKPPAPPRPPKPPAPPRVAGVLKPPTPAQIVATNKRKAEAQAKVGDAKRKADVDIASAQRRANATK